MLTRTHGEKIVRKSFLPTEKAEVREAKRQAAELIDFTWDFIPDNIDTISDEETRLLSKAIECFEEGCMWLVKGLTVEKQ